MNKDGTLDMEEFVALYQRMLCSPVLLHSNAKKIEETEGKAIGRIQAVQRGKKTRQEIGDPATASALALALRPQLLLTREEMSRAP